MGLSFVPVADKNRLVAKVEGEASLQDHMRQLQALTVAPTSIRTPDGAFLSVRGDRAHQVKVAGHTIEAMDASHEHYGHYERAAHAIEARGEGSSRSKS